MLMGQQHSLQTRLPRHSDAMQCGVMQCCLGLIKRKLVKPQRWKVKDPRLLAGCRAEAVTPPYCATTSCSGRR